MVKPIGSLLRHKKVTITKPKEEKQRNNCVKDVLLTLLILTVGRLISFFCRQIESNRKILIRHASDTLVRLEDVCGSFD